MRGAYAGASLSRFTDDWVFAPMQSADQDIRGDHRRLVNRSRELVRNDGLMRRYISLCIQNIVGPDGIRLQSRVKRTDGEYDRDINDRIHAAWKRWCAPMNASTDGRHSFQDVERRLVEDWKRDGEGLARMIPNFDNEFGFAIQLLDPDQLDIEFNRQRGREGNEVRMGVELNEWGRPVRYWFWDGHPTEPGRARKRIPVPAEEVIHLYRGERTGATRGVPRLAPVMIKLNMLRGYEEAELIAARTCAAKMGFFSQDPELAPDPDPNAQAEAPIRMDASPGTMEVLPPGLAFHAWDPQHPSGAYDPYTKSLRREICAGLDVSYVSMTGDLSEANYGSQRGGLLLERENHRIDQQYLISHVHRRIYREWMKWALTTGALQLPTRDREAWLAHEWLPRGWAWIDPEKEVKASILAIEYGLDSHTGVMGGMGREVEETFAEIDRVQQLAVEYGVTFKSPNSNKEAGNATGEDQNTTTDAANGRARARRLALAGGR